MPTAAEKVVIVFLIEKLETSFRSMRFKACQRLRSKADFAYLRWKGSRIEAIPFRVKWVLRKEVPSSVRRLGVIASKKVGNSVVRHRAKRLVRELFRLHQEALPKSVDVLIIVRPNFSQFSFQALQTFYLNLCQKMGEKLQ